MLLGGCLERGGGGGWGVVRAPFKPPPPGGGEGAIKAEGVCRLVLLGVRMCAPFEGGNPPLWVGCPPPLGEGGRFTKPREVGRLLGYRTAGGKIVFTV